MAVTPDDYLPLLTKRLDAIQPRISRNRQYSNGQAPMPEMGPNTKESWQAFQKKARTDMGGLTCRSLGGRIIPNGVRVGTSADNPGVLAARRVWRDNRLSIVFADAIWNMLSTSAGYLVTGVRNGEPIITSELPEQVITIPDPVQPWRAVAALRAWRDPDSGVDRAWVRITGVQQNYIRKSNKENGMPHTTVSGVWAQDGLPQFHDGGVGVFVLDNYNNQAEFEPHIDVIDRMNLGKLNRLVITAMQAFKQRAIKGGIPHEDEEGNSIDVAKMFEPAPGALWDLPEGIDIWESAQTDIRPLLEAEKADARDFSAVTSTPIDVFIPSGENQSATGAANSQKGEIAKARDRIERAKAGMSAAILEALRILGVDDGSTVDVLFETPDHVSLSEKTLAATQAKEAGRSSRWIARNIFGMTPDEIAEDEADLAAQQLQQFTLIGAPGGNA
jgi:hypothetical protein